jgi:hypothetical protein
VEAIFDYGGLQSADVASESVLDGSSEEPLASAKEEIPGLLRSLKLLVEKG